MLTSVTFRALTASWSAKPPAIDAPNLCSKFRFAAPRVCRDRIALRDAITVASVPWGAPVRDASA